MIRVLIVDDSPTARLHLQAILNTDPELAVVGEARDGQEAIRKCHKLRPDLVITDVGMPKMDGLEAIRHIMAESPRPIIVVTSTHSDQRLGGVRIKALESGALAVLGKPGGLPGEDPEADELVAQAKAMAGVKVVRRRWWLTEGKPKPPATERTQRTARPSAGSGSPRPVRVIAIGVSTGGPPVLQLILQSLPDELPIPVVIVQHISPGFAGGLARWLDETTPLRVKVADDGETLHPGAAYLAPDDVHLTVTSRRTVKYVASLPVNGHRPSADTLFLSVAEHYRSAAVGVLLTGMGVDGAQGLKAIREANGVTIVQDEATSVVFGMPKAAIALGAARHVLPADRIAGQLTALLRRSGATP